MKKIGVCLSGCGVQDGAEIHETACTLLAINKLGAEAICMAPESNQRLVKNHATGEEMNESRSIFIESARIARGDIKPISQIKANELDALIFPGGFGAALNLCDFGIKGEDAEALPEVAHLVKEMINLKKPVGAMCIAPALLATILKKDSTITPKLTIGTDPETASKLEAMGTSHINCPPTECVVDSDYNIVTTPAYMTGQGIYEISQGIEKLVHQVIKLANQ